MREGLYLRSLALSSPMTAGVAVDFSVSTHKINMNKYHACFNGLYFTRDSGQILAFLIYDKNNFSRDLVLIWLRESEDLNF